MKYIVIGSGGVGAVIAKDLGNAEETTAVCVADIDFEAAEQAAGEIGSKATAVRLDIYDAAVLVDLIKDYDVVVNVVGPYYKTAGPVLEACIAAKANYVDIADDSAGVEKLLTYGDACREAGITAVFSHGASPGITNALGLYGARQMDEVEEINTSWVVGSTGEPIGPANIWHVLEMCSTTIPQFLDGDWVEVPALTGSEEVEFRAPLGVWPVYYVGHAEPMTLPRYIKGLKKVTNKGNLWPRDADFNSLVGPYNELGLSGTDTLKIGDVEVSKRDFASVNIISMITESMEGTVAEGEDVGANLRIDVKGSIGGHAAHLVYTMVGDMNDLTGFSAAYAAQAVAAGDISEKGIFPPEGLPDPTPLFNYLAGKGIKIYEQKTVESLLEIADS